MRLADTSTSHTTFKNTLKRQYLRCWSHIFRLLLHCACSYSLLISTLSLPLNHNVIGNFLNKTGIQSRTLHKLLVLKQSHFSSRPEWVPSIILKRITSALISAFSHLSRTISYFMRRHHHRCNKSLFVYSINKRSRKTMLPITATFCYRIRPYSGRNQRFSDYK